MPYSKTYRKKPNLMALNHSIISISILFQTVIFLNYWFSAEYTAKVK